MADSFQQIGGIGCPEGAAIHAVALQVDEGRLPQIRVSVQH
jgi:hypothetical protein